MFDQTPSRGRRSTDVGTLRAYQLFFAIHCAGFLALRASGADQGLRTILHVFGLGGAVDSVWVTQLLSHQFLHLSGLEFVVSIGLLLALGGEVERALGSIRFSILYLASGAGVGLAYEVLALLTRDGVLAIAPPFVGGMGSSAALLSAYVLLEPRRRIFGAIPAAAFFVVMTTMLVASAVYIDQEPQWNMEELLRQTFPDGGWLDVQYDRTVREAPVAVHLLGLALGAGLLALDLAFARTFAVVRVKRDIRILEEELEARARVEQLLEKISRDGLQALSRRERKFLQYASRFYPPGRVLSDG
jgi:membrane associated rhomboid family serine protease